MTFMFGLVVIGNVVDNVSEPKWVTIFLQGTLGLCWIISGCLIHYFEKQDQDPDSPEHDSSLIDSIKQGFLNQLMVAQFLGSGVIIINILQISNWFTQMHINKMLALFLMTQFGGYMTPLDWIEKLYDSVHPIVYWGCGGGMLAISIVDKYIFAFHPL